MQRGDANPTGLATQVADLYLADRLQPAAPPPAAPGPTAPTAPVTAPQVSPAVDLSPYPGLFFNPVTSQVRRVYAKEGKLFYEREPGNETELAPLGQDRFVMVGSPGAVEVHFSTTPDGHREMIIPTAPGSPLFQAVEPASGSAESEAGLAGTYFSEELGIAYTLAVKDGHLVLTYANRLPGLVLQPAFADAFRAPGFGLLRLTRDAGKKVTGFTVNAGRLRNLGFTRVSGGPYNPPMPTPIHIIGGGLAGSECAWQLAERGVPVVLHEMRPVRPTPAHKTGDLAELVCSNSLRSDDPLHAAGLLKREMEAFGSLIIGTARRGGRAGRERSGRGPRPLRRTGDGGHRRPPPDRAAARGGDARFPRGGRGGRAPAR